MNPAPNTPFALPAFSRSTRGRGEVKAPTGTGRPTNGWTLRLKYITAAAAAPIELPEKKTKILMNRSIVERERDLRNWKLLSGSEAGTSAAREIFSVRCSKGRTLARPSVLLLDRATGRQAGIERRRQARWRLDSLYAMRGNFVGKSKR